ncbi:BspA family leucine-rich repeat surface protein [Dokdonia sp.]|uniref:BspA family leucine-rich repeat surface protein n=1 Tax=Dokdonia sp. TaxID=2024995 RepID=UPI003265E763
MKTIALILFSSLLMLLFTNKINAQGPPLPGLRPFVFKVKTDHMGDSEDNQFTIPTFSEETYEYEVDWNYDGNLFIPENTGITGSITHSYEEAGTYTIAIRGAFRRIYFNNAGDRLKIIEITQWGTNFWTSMENAFLGCSNLDITATDTPYLDDVISLESMFGSCHSLIGTESFNDWDVSHITNMKHLFTDSSFNSLINDWDVSQVTDMTGMFANNPNFNQPLDDWIVSNVTNMYAMFNSALAFNQDLTNWDVSNVEHMNYMFGHSPNFNGDISGWNVSQVTDMPGMFWSATAFDQNLGDWDLTNVTNMQWMFRGANMSTTNYDNTLIGWATDNSGENNEEDDIPTGIIFHGGSSQYCDSQTKRQELIEIYGWTIDDGLQHPNCGNITLNLKVYLQGAITNPITGGENLMRDDLRTANLIPTETPYTDDATIDMSVFDTNGSDAIVDWIWVELRDATDHNIIINAQSALLQRDGDIVAIDGTSELSFTNDSKDYYIAVKHRNHLGILTVNTVALSVDSTFIDLSSNTTAVTGGELALRDMNNGIFAMYAGDANTDGNILNTDITNVISTSGNINTYSGADINMDGNILNTDIALFIQLNAGRIQQF